MITVHENFRSVVKDPKSITEALQLLRSLTRLEFVVSIGGRLQRCPIRISDENALIEINLGAVTVGTGGTGGGVSGFPTDPAQGDLVFRAGDAWVSLAIGSPTDLLRVNAAGTAPEYKAANAVGHWEPMADGGPVSPEMIFDAGDVVLEFITSS